MTCSGIARLGERRTEVGSFFMDDDETPIAFVPSAVVLTIIAPDGTTTSKTWPAATDLLHHTAHEWYYDLTLDQRGRWEVSWVCTGSYTDANGDTRAYVEPASRVIRVYA